MIETDPTHDNTHTHLTPKESIMFTTKGDIDSIQWRSNHIVDDWTNLQSYRSGDTGGQITALDLIQQFQHLPGIDLMVTTPFPSEVYNQIKVAGTPHHRW